MPFLTLFCVEQLEAEGALGDLVRGAGEPSFNWAADMVNSRAFTNQLSGSGFGPVLIPIADLSNHTDTEPTLSKTVWDSVHRCYKVKVSGCNVKRSG